MSVYEFIFGLFSVILSLAITQMLTTTVGLIQNAERVRFSATQALWMLLFLLTAIGNWVSLWSLRGIGTWGPPQLLCSVSLVIGQFIACALVCPPIRESGEIDMAAFHDKERRRYLAAYLVLGLLAVMTNVFFSGPVDLAVFARSNAATAPAIIATLLALLARNVWLQRIGLGIDTVMVLGWLATRNVSPG